jgi:hypothetical protein
MGIQYVVGNMFRFSLNRRKGGRPKEEIEELHFRPEDFSSFLLTKATKSTYFVLVFLAIPAIPAAGGMVTGGGEVLRLSILPETHGARRVSKIRPG